MYNSLILEEAQLDVDESIEWYLSKSYPIAENFIKAFENTIKIICEHPYRWRNTFGEYYELSFKKFPFAVVYLINEVEKLIIITAVYHHKRNPESKFE